MKNRRKITLRRPVRSSMLFLIFQLGARVLAFLTTPIFTRLLTPTEYALTPLYFTWQTILSALVTLELTGSVLLTVMANRRRDTDALLASTHTLCILTLFILLLVYLLFGRQIDRFTGLSRSLTLLLFLHTLASLSLTLYSAKAKFLYRPERTLPLMFATSVLGPAIGIFLVTFTPLRTEGRVIGMTLATVLAAIPLIVCIYKDGKCLLARAPLGELLSRGLPLLPHYLGLTALAEMGRVFVSRSATPEALAKLGIAGTLSHAITMLIGAINSAFFPWVLRRLRGKEEERVKAMSRAVLFTVLTGALTVGLLAPEALALLAPSAYGEAGSAILPLLYTTIPSFIYTLYAGVTLYRRRTLPMTVATLCATLVSLALHLWLVPKYSFVGAAWATAIGYTLLALLHLGVAAMGEKNEKKSKAGAHRLPLSLDSLPLSLSPTLCSLTLGILGAILLPLLYPYALIRYALSATALSLLAVFAYRRRREVLDT